ncbi:MAG: glycoside transferase family 32 [Prevotella sp.]|nr:glycoside transferase family 32 [Prevotella sp.]
MIPKNIHLVFLSKNEPFPELFTNCMKLIKEYHPSWNIYLYDKDDADRIMKEHLPDFLPAYNSLKYDVQRADFLRLALVYIYGGFYMDLDMFCLKSLDELLKYQVVLGEEKTICIEEQKSLNLQHRLRIANYMFGGIAYHEFWLSTMKLLASRANIPIESQQDIVDKTGPGLLTDLYHEMVNTHPEIMLLRNTTRRCMQPYHNDISCHFGEYAAHLHSGTWRGSIK